MGKLRGNSKGTEYTLYDDGAGADEHEMAALADEFWRSGFEDDDAEAKVEIRNCLAGIVYRTPKEVKLCRARRLNAIFTMLDNWSCYGSGDPPANKKDWTPYPLAR